MPADHDPTAYGRNIADDYDRLYGATLETDDAVDLLVELAEGGPLLEWGVGTGRLALPLAARGVPVHGLDSSEEMLAALRAKPGGADLGLARGDFTSTVVEGRFRLVLLAFNTLFALPDQDAQVACFEHAARHLDRGGRFVVEVAVPDPTRFHRHGGVWPRALGEGLALVVAQDDPVTQRMQTVELHLGGSELRTLPMNHRYVWPSEMDLMARLAGFTLEHRWSSWRRERFTATSTQHVSIYRLGPVPHG